jgi:hypothetical protein
MSRGRAATIAKSLKTLGRKLQHMQHEKDPELGANNFLSLLFSRYCIR